MKALALVVICILIGCLMPLQGSVNSRLATYLHHPLQAAMVSLTTSFLIITSMVLVSGHPLPSLKAAVKIPPVLFIGGLCGVIFVTASILLIPKLGVATVLAGFIAGQLVFSVVIDHFGLFGVQFAPRRPLYRLLGISLLFIGVFLIQRF